MPLTLAHPAAVVPVARALRTRVVLSALVMGSIAPDFAQLLQLPLPRSASHGISSIVYFIPTGLAAYLLFHRLMKRPVVALLPDALQRRLMRGGMLATPSNWGLVVFSIALGALTHIAWDSFTHADGPMVVSVPALRVHLFTISGYRVFVFKVLQHGSTALGCSSLGGGSWRGTGGLTPARFQQAHFPHPRHVLESRCA